MGLMGKGEIYIIISPCGKRYIAKNYLNYQG